MFTGIIVELGTVERLTVSGDAAQLWIQLPRLAKQVKRGDSIAINGVCLTATTIQGDTIRFDVMQATLTHSMLQSLRSGEHVNAEPALRAGDAMGGHWVQGHVDGVGVVKTINPTQAFTLMTIEAPDTVTRYCVPKGSITISGVSLTLADVTPSTLRVSLIPTTREDTLLGTLRVGDLVNLEVDILGKYVYHYLAAAKMPPEISPSSTLSEGFLREHGF